MLPQARRNLVLLVIVAMLLALWWLLPDRDATQDQARLLDGNPSRVTIFVGDDDTPGLDLMQQDGDWMVRSETGDFAPADTASVNALLAALNAPSRRSWSRAEVDLAELGLDQPRYRVLVDGRALLVGDRGALGNQRYVADGERVLLVSDVLIYHLQRPLDSYLPQDRAGE